jgi:putative hemolysin
VAKWLASSHLLRETLAAVHQQTRSGRTIWCVPVEGFATTVSTRLGVLFGGAWSPAFLRDTTSASPLGVPWVVHLANVRLALVESATDG